MGDMNQISDKQSTTRLVILALFCCLLWGSAPVLIKLGYEAFSIHETPSILLFAGFRFILAGVFVLLFFISKKKNRDQLHFTGETSEAIIWLALFQTFGQYFFYYIGVSNSTGVSASILSGASCFFALVLASCIYQIEKMSAVKVISCILGFLGILVMNLNGFQFSFSFQGEGMLLLSQICSAESAVLIKLFSKKENTVFLSGAQFLLGGLMLSALGWVMGGSLIFSKTGLFILLALSFVSAGAYTIWGILLSHYPVSQVGIFTCTIPLFGVLFSILVLHEFDAVNIQTLFSLILIVSGIILLNRPTRSKKQKGT